MERLHKLGATGRSRSGVLTRLALSEEDKAARDLLVGWMREAGLTITVDAIGNIFGLWPGGADGKPIMIGSHIDTVIDAGIYDGCYGVLSGLAVVEALQRDHGAPFRPLVVAAFTNEEGVRYQPDMMGSLVYAGGYDLQAALAAIGSDGSVLGQELARVGYAGDVRPGAMRPAAYLELHVEQGPVLEAEGCAIGAVENLQGISWQRVTMEGVANHAGTTPSGMRRDAGLAAARVVTFLRDELMSADRATVATVGTMRFEPNAINIIPARATFTIDLRDPDERRLRSGEDRLREFLRQVAAKQGVKVTVEPLVRFEPVAFNPDLVKRIERAAASRNCRCRRMTSGAGHDAQMMARICPAAMIFVPSKGGISHNPAEDTKESDLIAGANVLLEVVAGLPSRWK